MDPPLGTISLCLPTLEMWDNFRKNAGKPFPKEITEKADQELDYMQVRWFFAVWLLASPSLSLSLNPPLDPPLEPFSTPPLPLHLFLHSTCLSKKE